MGSSTSSEASSSPPERAWQRAVQIASARPCWTIAALGALLAVGNQWWVRRNRFLGATDADEAGYLATALRFQRSALDGPGVLWDRITESTSGPLVPLLSLPFTHLDGRNVWGAQAIQPVLHVIAAVAVTGITVRLAHRRAGLLAGVLALALPTALVAARSYQFNLGASAFLLGAVWALLASDRGRRPWPMAAMGLCAAAMTMSRTMTVGYLPALALGAAIGIRWDRRGLRSAGIAAGAFLLAAGPWWLTSWDGATAYLRRNGSSEFSEYWGPADVAGRVVERLGRLLVDLRIPLLLLGTVVVVLGLVSARRHHRSGRAWRAGVLHRRDLAVVATIILGCYASLLSTANTGTWFDTPQQLLALSLTVAVAAHLAREPGSDRLVHGLAGGALIVACLTVLVAVPDSRGPDQYADPVAGPGLLYGGVDRIQDIFTRADRRLESADRAERRRAAAEWFDVNVETAEEMDRLNRAAGGTRQVVVGSSDLISVNTILLAAELQGLQTGTIEVPFTLLPDDELAPLVHPEVDGRPRAIIRIDSDAELFPDDSEAARFDDLAEGAGWLVHRRIELPDGGEVRVLLHPQSSPVDLAAEE